MEETMKNDDLRDGVYVRSVEQEGNKITFRVTAPPRVRTPARRSSQLALFCAAFLLVLLAIYFIFFR